MVQTRRRSREPHSSESQMSMRLHLAREARPLTQTELAARMRERGHTQWRQSTVARVEQSTRPMYAAELLSLSHILGWDRLMPGYARLARDIAAELPAPGTAAAGIAHRAEIITRIKRGLIHD